MHYGIVTQRTAEYTERQLRAYPLPSQRTQDGATPVSAAQARKLARRMASCGTVLAGGIRATIISADQAAKIGA